MVADKGYLGSNSSSKRAQLRNTNVSGACYSNLPVSTTLTEYVYQFSLAQYVCVLASWIHLPVAGLISSLRGTFVSALFQLAVIYQGVRPCAVPCSVDGL